MKKLIAFLLIGFMLSANAQIKNDGNQGTFVKHDTVKITKHDTIQVTFAIAFDTTGIHIIYYGDKGRILYVDGFTIRTIRYNTSNPGDGQVISAGIYDNHFVLFKKEILDVKPIPKK